MNKRARAPRKIQPTGGVSANTRDKILDRAEALFAERGFHGVSLREIMKSCDVQLAAVAYYFGTKEQLYRAVFERRADELNRMRHDRLDAAVAAAKGSRPSEQAVIEALVGPFLDRFLNGGPGWRSFCTIIAHTTISREWGELMSEMFDEVARRTIALLGNTEGSAPPDGKAVSAYLFMVGAMAVIFSRTGRLDRLSGGDYRSDDVRRIYADMVPFLAAGVRGLLPEQSAQTPRPVRRAGGARSRQAVRA